MSGQGFSDFFYQAPDGLKLHARIYGEELGGHWPVICLPGLTRNVRDFHELALYLSREAATPRKVVAFDYRGRGESAYDPDATKYNVGVEAGDTLAGMAALGITEAAFIGTSRGGLIIHVLGMIKRGVLKAIVLNDIGPAMEVAGLIHIRDYLAKAPRPETLAEAVAAQRAAHSADFSALSDADWQRMVAAIYREQDGRLVPDFDVKLLAGLADMDLTKPLPTMWPQFEALGGIPVLAIRGANSRLLSAAGLEEMKARHPKLTAITVEGQGHAPFLETGTLPGAIESFIDQAESAETASSAA